LRSGFWARSRRLRLRRFHWLHVVLVGVDCHSPESGPAAMLLGSAIAAVASERSLGGS
jgi:hypothetical protein